METSLLVVLMSAVLCTWAYTSHYSRSFNITREVNWTAAQTECREHYTDLVTLHSQEEAKITVDTIKKLTDAQILWIGLSRANNSLKWSNGENVTYTKSTPNDGRTDPYCYAMKTDGRWDKVKFDRRKAFMCYSQGDGEDPPRYTPHHEKLSWCEAQTFCRVHYTDLVSISSQKQNDEVKNYGTDHAPFWIGLKNDAWEWSDGDCSTFRDWGDKEPKANCSYLLPHDPTRMGTQGCENNGVGICYEDEIYLINTNKTWEQALAYCNQNHSGLLRIESPQDQRHLEAYLSKRTALSGHVWLGLRQSRLFGFWIWTNGQNVGWSNWERGSQPEQPLSHVCGAIATSGPGKYKWSDQNCLSKRYFLCEGKRP